MIKENMKNNSLTQRQRKLYNIIETYIRDNDSSPTLSELMEEMGISTKKGVAFHLDALERKGYITRTGGSRGIRLIKDMSGQFVPIAIIGYANAGEPLIDAQEEFIGEIMVEEKIIRPRRKVFGIELRGDSMNQRVMNGVKMDNGNYVIVAKDVAINDGDVVIATINGSATVKTYHRKGDMLILSPESDNPIHHPIYMSFDTDLILGKVITVLDNPAHQG